MVPDSGPQCREDRDKYSLVYCNVHLRQKKANRNVAPSVSTSKSAGIRTKTTSIAS